MDLLQQVVEQYRGGDIHEALQGAQAACDRRPGDAEAWTLLGQIARHAGMPAASDLAFQRAAEIDAGLGLPYRVGRERFTELVLQLAPAKSHVHVEDFPSPELIRRGVPPDALIHSEPGAARVLFQVNFENQARSEEDLRSLLTGSLASA